MILIDLVLICKLIYDYEVFKYLRYWLNLEKLNKILIERVDK